MGWSLELREATSKGGGGHANPMNPGGVAAGRITVRPTCPREQGANQFRESVARLIGRCPGSYGGVGSDATRSLVSGHAVGKVHNGSECGGGGTVKSDFPLASSSCALGNQLSASLFSFFMFGMAGTLALSALARAKRVKGVNFPSSFGGRRFGAPVAASFVVPTSLPSVGDLDTPPKPNPRSRIDRHTARDARHAQKKIVKPKKHRNGKCERLSGANGSWTGSDDVAQFISCEVPLGESCLGEEANTRHFHKRVKANGKPLTAAARRFLEKQQKEGAKARPLPFRECAVEIRACPEYQNHFHRFVEEKGGNEEGAAPLRAPGLAVPVPANNGQRVDARAAEAFDALAAILDGPEPEQRFVPAKAELVVAPRVVEVEEKGEEKREEKAVEEIFFGPAYGEEEAYRLAMQEVEMVAEEFGYREEGGEYVWRGEDPAAEPLIPRAYPAPLVGPLQLGGEPRGVRHPVVEQALGVARDVAQELKEGFERALRPTPPPPPLPRPTDGFIAVGRAGRALRTQQVVLYYTDATPESLGVMKRLGRAILKTLPGVKTTSVYRANTGGGTEVSGTTELAPHASVALTFVPFWDQAHRRKPFTEYKSDSNQALFFGLGFNSCVEVPIFTELLAALRSTSTDEGRSLQSRPCARHGDNGIEVIPSFGEAVATFMGKIRNISQYYECDTRTLDNTASYYLQQRLVRQYERLSREPKKGGVVFARSALR